MKKDSVVSNDEYYEAYIEGTDIKVEFEMPKNATINEKRFEAEQRILRAINIRFKKKKKQGFAH